MTREFDHEEDFHGRDRKHWRKERRHAQETDRSKFKKTDLTEKKTEIDPSWRRGRVIALPGDKALVDLDGIQISASLKGLLKKEKGETKTLIAVGDFVYLTPDDAIAHIEERYSILSRTDIRGIKEQLIAVNVDQVIIVASCGEPNLKPALIDRYLIAAEKGNLHPIVVINKTDLHDPLYEEFIRSYAPLGIPILSVSTETNAGIESLRSILKNKASVFAGQSGVGKSSLLNACFGLTLKTGELAHKTQKGTHTTTTTLFIPLPGGGYCVDTPGIRSFSLWNLTKDDVMSHFHDLAPTPCKFPDCQHISEPGCAVLSHIISQMRYDSYRSLLDEALGRSDNWTKRKLDESD